jgi:lipoprotein-anchoring transpeptidase ErfK/SrfK
MVAAGRHRGRGARPLGSADVQPKPRNAEYGPIFGSLQPDLKETLPLAVLPLDCCGLCREMAAMERGSAWGRKAQTRAARSRVDNGRMRAIALAAFVVYLLAPGIAHAQFSFWPRHGFWPGQYVPLHRHKHYRHANPELARNVQPEAPTKGPLQIIISIPDQRVSLYENAALIARSSASTGTQQHPTPVGVFSVIGKQRWHRSNIYSGAPMPYMQRITWSGIALHAGVVPGYPASHGCIRLTSDFAIRLWHLTKRGTRVIIAPGDIQPVEIANARLFKRKVPATSPEAQPATDSGNSVGTAELAHNSHISDAETQEAASIRVSSPASSSAVSQKIIPVSVFISRRLSKLFVRRGFSPLFEAPVKIQNPEEPIGTHVFTAMESQNGEADIRWIVVSMPPELPRVIGPSAKPREKPAKHKIEIPLPTPSPDAAGAALERVEIPQDAVERISDLLTPASSLIISDNGFSRETGRDTDFIVMH